MPKKVSASFIVIYTKRWAPIMTLLFVFGQKLFTFEHFLKSIKGKIKSAGKFLISIFLYL